MSSSPVNPASEQPPAASVPPLPTLQEKVSKPPGAVSMPSAPATSLEGLKDLLEKNIKWSQLIYEQNRKIRRSLFIASIFNWIKIVLVVAILSGALFFITDWYRGLQKKYPSIFGSSKTMATSTTSSWDDFLNSLPLNDGQRQQLKSLVK